MSEIKSTIQPSSTINAEINPSSKVTSTAIGIHNINAASVGLGNVTNESKATMFTNPTFTGSVTGTLGTAAQPNITSVGTIGTGVWQGTPIVSAYVGDLPTSKITSGTFADTRIAESNVTQHQAALSLNGSQITSGTIPDNRIAQTNVTQHQAALSIGASQLTGTIDDARLPSGIARDTELTAHTSLTNNPHSVTKTQVGLSNVENKSAADIIGEIVDSDIPSTIARDSELSAHTDLTNNPHSVTKTQVGLSNVDNESKAVMFTDPTFTGNPQSSAAPTSGNHLTNKTYVDAQVASVVDSAPAALDTLNELAAALGDNANFATTTATSIGEKLAKASNLSDLANATTARTNLGLGNVEDKSSATIRSEIVDSDIPSTITRDSELSAHTALTNNPHSVTATQLNLENVTNESKTTMFSNPTFTGTVNTSEILSSQTSLAGLIIRGRNQPSSGPGGKVVIRGGQGGEGDDDDGNVEIGLTNTNLVDLGSTRASSLQVTGNITGVNLSGLLQSNNNRSVVIGELAAPSETAPNTEADPTIYRENIAIGYQALNYTSTGTNNVAIGTDALKVSTTGKNNIAIGKKALETVNSERNIALGFNCLNVANVNDDNVVIGSTNLQNLVSTGIDGNIIIGKGAGNSGNTGFYNDNIILGRAAFQGTTASSVANIILLGQRAGKSLKGVGDNDIGIGKNVFFGANAGFNSAGNNIAIGENAQSNPIEATAKVNGATSSTTALVVDSNAGKILTGMTVTGTGISGTVTVTTVTDQNNLVLSSAQTLSDNVNLTFTKTEPTKGSIKIGADGGTAGSFSTNISTVDTVTTLPGGGNRTVNKVTGSHSGLVGGFANIVSAETAFIGGGKDNVIAEEATGAAILGGFDNDITGRGSAGMALGSNLRVQGTNQVVVGRYNIGNDSSKFIVGAGYGEATRTNAFEVRNNSQLKLGKYGTTNYTYDGNRNYNILAVGAANNVVEIPLHDDKLDSQYLSPEPFTISTSSITFLPVDAAKIVKLTWTGSTGTAQVNLPLCSNYVNRSIRIVTDGTIPDDGIVLLHRAAGGSDTIAGSTSGLKLRGKHQSAMLWSDGVSNYSNIGLDSSAVKFDVNGDITLTQGTARTIKIARATVAENGDNLTIEAGRYKSGTEGNGGNLTLKAGSGDSSDGNGGDLILSAGSGDTSGVIKFSGTEFLLTGGTSARTSFRSAIGLGSAATTASTDYAPAAGSSNITTVGTLTSLAVAGNIVADGTDHQLKIGGNARFQVLDGLVKALTSFSVNDTLYTFGNNELGNQTTDTTKISGDLMVDTDTLKVDVANDRVGINKASPEEALDVVGNVKVDGTIKSTSYEPADFPTTSTVRTTAAFKEDGTMVQDEKVIVKKVTGAQAKAMTTNSSTFIELIPAPGANKVIVVRELEIFIDRGTWTPITSGQVRGWGNNLLIVIETPAKTNAGVGSSGFNYNTYATLQKKYLNHTINNVFVSANAVDTIIVRDAPVTQTRAYPNVPLLLRPQAANTYADLFNYNQTVDDDYYFRITYKIMDMTTDFAVTTT